MNLLLVNLFCANLIYCMSLEDSNSRTTESVSLSSSSENPSGPGDGEPTTSDYQRSPTLVENFLPPPSDRDKILSRWAGILPSAPEPFVTEDKISFTETANKVMEAFASIHKERKVGEPGPKERKTFSFEPKEHEVEHLESNEDLYDEPKLKELGSVSPEPSEVMDESQAPMVLRYLNDTLLLASEQGDIETIKLIITVEKLEPTIYTALITAIQHEQKEATILIAGHLSCPISVNDFKAARLAVSNRMSVELVILLLKGNRWYETPTLEDAIVYCVKMGLLDVFDYLAVYYDHPVIIKVPIQPQKSMFQKSALLATFGIEDFYNDAFRLETELKRSQKAIFKAHEQSKMSLRNMLIKHAMKSYDKFKKRGSIEIHQFRYLASVLDAIKNIQFMTLADTGMDTLPNDIKRVIFDTILDKAIDTKQRDDQKVDPRKTAFKIFGKYR